MSKTATKERKESELDELKLVKKSDILLLKVYTYDEYDSGCNFAIMQITDEARKALVALKSVVDIINGKDDEGNKPADLYKLSYWSPMWGADFLHTTDCEDAFEDINFFKSNNEIQHLSKMIEANSNELCIDVNLMNVYEDGIRFECLIKHTDVKMETARISFKTLGI